MNKKLSIAITVAGLALSSAVFAAGKQKPSAELATPFGVGLGKTTCTEVAKSFSTSVSPFDGMSRVAHPRPQEVVPGAVELSVLCHKPDTAVEMLSVTVNKSESPAIYQSLTKYKLVRGGPPPRLGDTFALFNDAAGSVIQMSAPHLSFNVDVNYMTADIYGRLIAYQEAQREEQAKKRGKF